MTHEGISHHVTKERSRIDEAIRLMTQFAGRTGLLAVRPPKRYLWTDAFAVCNFLSIARATGNKGYTELAVRLVDQVHATLGRHRPDDPRGREGWLSGLEDDEAALHPTLGGLRIGKPLPDRASGEAFDADVEWDRDGQYFHYLTKWMHALDQVAHETGDLRYNLWARELAKTAFEAFTYRDTERGLRMVWKKSVDLSRTLVRSMGQHDPIDGLVTCLELQATAASGGDELGGPELRAEAAAFASMAVNAHWVTVDPLGIGGLLVDACRLAMSRRQLASAGSTPHEEWLPALLAAALDGIMQYGRRRELQQPASTRLAFRELGLAIGLSSVELIDRALGSDASESSQRADALALVQRLGAYRQLGTAIESFWRAPEHRRDPSWSAHEDINDVMLATTLLPDGFLVR